MTSHLCLVFSNAVSTTDDPDTGSALVASVPAGATTERYRLSPLQRTGPGEGTPPSWHDLAIVALEPEALSQWRVAGDASAAAHGREGGALAQAVAVWAYAPAGPRVAEADVAPPSKPRLGTGRHVFLALTNPTAGREDDFRAWYAIHVPEVVEHFAGLVSGQLFESGGVQPGGAEPFWRYLAVYELVADDVAEYLRHEAATRERGLLVQNGGALAPGSAVWIYSRIPPA